jgi:hypothetical protein
MITPAKLAEAGLFVELQPEAKIAAKIKPRAVQLENIRRVCGRVVDCRMVWLQNEFILVIKLKFS